MLDPGSGVDPGYTPADLQFATDYMKELARQFAARWGSKGGFIDVFNARQPWEAGGPLDTLWGQSFRAASDVMGRPWHSTPLSSALAAAILQNLQGASELQGGGWGDLIRTFLSNQAAGHNPAFPDLALGQHVPGYVGAPSTASSVLASAAPSAAPGAASLMRYEPAPLPPMPAQHPAQLPPIPAPVYHRYPIRPGFHVPEAYAGYVA